MAHEIKNRLIYSVHDKRLKELASRYLRGRLLDIGCGVKPYRDLLSSYVSEHIGLEQADGPHDTSGVDLFASAYEIPVDDGSFDSAICTSVLEHLEDPERALRECLRILRPDGVAIYSVPFIWHLHEEPRDFYRFSKHGLIYLFERSGFEVLELEPLTGFWGTFGQLFVYYLYRFNKGPMRWLRIIDAVSIVIQSAAHLMDRIDKADQWTLMYMVVARRRGGNAKAHGPSE
jgi:SAM-dependent methyltransferase